MTNIANKATHYVKLGKKDERVPNAITTLFVPRVMIKAIIIIPFWI